MNKPGRRYSERLIGFWKNVWNAEDEPLKWKIVLTVVAPVAILFAYEPEGESDEE